MKDQQYEPELGQVIFGQPFKQFSVPEYVDAMLEHIRKEVNRVEWNNRQKEFDPFGNTGQEYKNEAFEVQAYSWDESKEQPYNFKWKDFEVSWYKYLGRGMSMNRETTPDEMSQMLTDCLEATRALEKELF